MITAVSASTAISAYGAYSSSQAANRGAAIAEDNANRRYLMQSGIAEAQMEEQAGIARDKMTEISRAFLQAKGKATAIQAETMVGGKTAQRIAATTRTKFSEAKGKVAQEVDTNVMNIAQGMLAKKIDTEAMIMEARNKKQNVYINTLGGAIQGAASGYMLGTTIAGAGGTGVDKLASTSAVEGGTVVPEFEGLNMGYLYGGR